GRAKEAIAEFTELLSLYPTDVNALIQIGLAEKEVGDIEVAQVWFERAVDADPGSSLVHFYLGEIAYNRGMLDVALQRLQQAIEEVHLLRRELPAAREAYETLVQRIPDSAKLWNERGLVLHQSGEFDEARASYERAVECEPGYAIALNNAGVAMFHGGKTE